MEEPRTVEVEEEEATLFIEIALLSSTVQAQATTTTQVATQAELPLHRIQHG